MPFASDVHTLIAGYVKSKTLLGEKITLSEIFDFFDEGTPEYEELCRVLDLNDGENLKAKFAQVLFSTACATEGGQHSKGDRGSKKQFMPRRRCRKTQAGLRCCSSF